MQMLEAAGVTLLVDAHRAADLDNPRGYFEYAPVKATLRDASWLAHAAGRAVKVVSPLLPALPPSGAYRVVLMQRAIGEVIASQRVMLERAGVADDGLSESVLRAVLSRQQREAEAWSRDHARLLCVEHAELMREPKSICAALSSFVGATDASDAAAAMAGCIDPALHRQRESELSPPG